MPIPRQLPWLEKAPLPFLGKIPLTPGEGKLYSRPYPRLPSCGPWATAAPWRELLSPLLLPARCWGWLGKHFQRQRRNYQLWRLEKTMARSFLKEPGIVYEHSSKMLVREVNKRSSSVAEFGERFWLVQRSAWQIPKEGCPGGQGGPGTAGWPPRNPSAIPRNPLSQHRKWSRKPARTNSDSQPAPKVTAQNVGTGTGSMERIERPCPDMQGWSLGS